MLKKLLLLIFLISCHFTYAGHEKGGVFITYKSVAGNPLQYEVEVYAIFYKAAVPPSNSLTLNISGCYGGAFSLPKVSTSTGTYLPLAGADYCSSTSNIATSYGLVKYKGLVNLPAHCANLTMYVETSIGQLFGANNLTNTMTTGGYFYTTLNTFMGNNSPQLNIADMYSAVCTAVNQNLFSIQDSEGDSLYITPSTPHYRSSGTIYNYSFASGYSRLNPVNASSYLVNSTNGSVQTNIPSQGFYVLPLTYKEYRVDPSTNTYVLVGSGQWVFSVIATSCTPPPIHMVHEAIPNPDTVKCPTNKLRVSFDKMIARGSLSPDGSDFKVKSTTSGMLSINNVRLYNDSIVELRLAANLQNNDNLIVYTSTGNDGDVIFSRCGAEATAAADTLRFYVRAGQPPNSMWSNQSKFRNLSYSGAGSTADSVLWIFGDGQTSVSLSGKHTYPAAGSYTLKLLSFGACGLIDTLSQTVQICDSIAPNFAHTVVGDTVFFTVNSSASLSYYWNFGDGNAASGMGTSHIYSGGKYLVELTAVNACGDSLSFNDSVEVCMPPLASWTYKLVNTSGSGMVVDFDGTASLNAKNYRWDFGDGNTNNTSLTPRHTYVTPGLHYKVSLYIENECGKANTQAYKLSEIGLVENPISKFSIFPNPARESLNIEWESDLIPKSYCITEIGGKQLMNGTFNTSGRQTIEISTLASGVYLLHIVDEQNQLASFKIIH